MVDARIPRGFSDSFASEVEERREMIERICEVYRLFGFEPLETPMLEYVDVLGKFLPESDTPEGGIFSLRDSDRQWLALRYDLTAPLSRVVAQHKLPSPFRRYQYGPVFRNEKTDAGRFRQFYQCDFDTVGASSAASDAEVCMVLLTAFKRLGISHEHMTIRVNHRKVLDGLLEVLGIVAKDDDAETRQARRLAVLRAMDKLDRLGPDGVDQLLGKGRRDESGDFTTGAGLSEGQRKGVLDFLAVSGTCRGDVLRGLESFVSESAAGREGLEDLRLITSVLDQVGIEREVVYSPSVIRGLAYYTGPVFEASLALPSGVDDAKEFGSVAGGGRYDDLVMRFTGQRVPATGASIGVDRLLVVLRAYGRRTAAAHRGPIVVVVVDRGLQSMYQGLAAEVRAAGLPCEVYLGEEAGLGKQFRYAEDRGSPLVIVAGPEEVGRGEVAIKDMRRGKELAADGDFTGSRERWLRERPGQRTVEKGQLVDTLRQLLGAPS